MKLKQPGSIVLGHAFLQPGEWGRFKGLPVRRDVAEGLIDQGITVLRYGGSMVNNGGYKWKKMIGPRDRRPPYAGTWYRYSSNGWGIPDFMDFCEAAGFEYVPAFNMDETPQDMADFIEYAKGPADSEWGRRRVADGHPQPYRLRYLELGNEERVDEKYAAKFEALGQGHLGQGPGDHPGRGRFRSTASPSRIRSTSTARPRGITSLAGQQRILRLAKQHNREVWFDVHVGTDDPRHSIRRWTGCSPSSTPWRGSPTAPRHKVVVFEFNAGNHAQKRALANALAINADRARRPHSHRHLRQLPSARRPERQRLGPGPPVPQSVAGLAAAARLRDADALPQLPAAAGQCQVTGAEGKLDVNAKRSDDGKTLVLQVVNSGEKAVAAQIHLAGFVPGKPAAQVSELSGPLEAVNTADKPRTVTPQQSAWKHGIKDGQTSRTFPPHSFTVIAVRLTGSREERATSETNQPPLTAPYCLAPAGVLRPPPTNYFRVERASHQLIRIPRRARIPPFDETLGSPFDAQRPPNVPRRLLWSQLVFRATLEIAPQGRGFAILNSSVGQANRWAIEPD